MNNNFPPLNLSLALKLDSSADASELDRLNRSLRAEIEDLGVESVSLVSAGPAPHGAKAVDATVVGALAIAVLPVVIPKLIEFLQSWTMRSAGRTLKIKTQIGDRSIEVECDAGTVSRQELAKLVDTLSSKLADLSQTTQKA